MCFLSLVCWFRSVEDFELELCSYLLDLNMMVYLMFLCLSDSQIFMSVHESVWWMFKQLFEKGYVYQGLKVRQFRAMLGLGFKEQTDPLLNGRCWGTEGVAELSFLILSWWMKILRELFEITLWSIRFMVILLQSACLFVGSGNFREFDVRSLFCRLCLTVLAARRCRRILKLALIIRLYSEFLVSCDGLHINCTCGYVWVHAVVVRL